jgi:nucleoside-diphosphate-sugar epimerase
VSAAAELHVAFGNGPVGLAVIDTLMRHGKPVRVASRSGGRRTLPADVEVTRGDATNPEDTRRVCAGASQVYNCTNAPDYHRWPEQFPPLQRGILAGASAAGARLIVMENLYMYGPHGGVPTTETMPPRGRGSRSTTRRLLTGDLFAAHRAGEVQATSVRASDLLGPHVTESLVGERFFGPFLAGRKGSALRGSGRAHSVSFVGDVGRAMVGAGDDALGRAWHVPNAPAVTPRAFADIVGEETGISPRLSAVPRPVTRSVLPAIGLAVPPMRGLVENLYVFYEPYVVDHSAYAAAFGDDATPLREAIRQTVAWARGNSDRTTEALPAAHTLARSSRSSSSSPS